MAVLRTGDWGRARAALAAGAGRLKRAVDQSVAEQAHALRNEIVQGLTRQAPGGEPILPLSELTLAKRPLLGRGGTKALIVRADLRNSITVILRGDEAFIGIKRAAKGREGQSLVNIAELQEFGSQPIIIPITPKMRRFLFALRREAGQTPSGTGGSGTGVVVVRIPARPFLRPAFAAFRKGARERFLAGVARRLGWRGLP